MPSYGEEACARLTDVALGKGNVADFLDRRHRVVVLREAHRPAGHRGRGAAQQLGGFGDLVAAQPSCEGDEVPIQIADVRPPAVEALRVARDECFIERTPLCEEMPESLEQSEIPVDLDRQVEVR